MTSVPTNKIGNCGIFLLCYSRITHKFSGRAQHSTTVEVLSTRFVCLSWQNASNTAVAAPLSSARLSMGLLAFLLRLDVGERSARHEALEQSPLHFLPAPILVLLAFLCLLLAACVAGLTLGLMSLDAMQLDILTQSSNLRVAAAARAIKPVRAQGNLLLVTLLFANTVATELLPLVLEALVPGGFFSLIVSVISIMLFGEIIPQAVCSRHALEVGAYMIHFVKVLRWILYPITYPIAFCLDFVLGEELCTIYDRHGLKALVDHHASESILTADETTILKSTLEFSQKKVMDILTPAEHVFKLSIDATLNRETLLDILRRGHSRVPLYDGSPSNIVCLLLVKQLLLVDPAENIPIRALISKKRVISKIRVARTIECSARTPIADLLNEFQLGRSHMAMVYDDVSKPHEERMFLGLVSIEDIIEEILGMLPMRFSSCLLYLLSSDDSTDCFLTSGISCATFMCGLCR